MGSRREKQVGAADERGWFLRRANSGFLGLAANVFGFVGWLSSLGRQWLTWSSGGFRGRSARLVDPPQLQFRLHLRRRFRSPRSNQWRHRRSRRRRMCSWRSDTAITCGRCSSSGVSRKRRVRRTASARSAASATSTSDGKRWRWARSQCPAPTVPSPAHAAHTGIYPRPLHDGLPVCVFRKGKGAGSADVRAYTAIARSPSIVNAKSPERVGIFSSFAQRRRPTRRAHDLRGRCGPVPYSAFGLTGHAAGPATPSAAAGAEGRSRQRPPTYKVRT